MPLLESDWNAQPLRLETRPHPNPNQPVDRGVGLMSNPAGIQRIIRIGTRAITPAGIRLKPNLWCTLVMMFGWGPEGRTGGSEGKPEDDIIDPPA